MSNGGEGAIRNMLVVFGVQVNNLKKAQELEDGIEAISNGMAQLNNMAKSAAIGIAALSAGVIASTKPMADYAEETDKYSKAFGISTTRMQELGFGIEALGAKKDDLSDVFLQISEKVKQATSGSKEAGKAFKDMGIDVNSLKGLAPDEVFDRMINGFKGITDSQTKFALISQLLGEDLGKKLLPVMAEGGKSLDDYAQIAREAGAVMNEQQVKMGTRVADTYRKLGTVLKALRMRIGLELMPYVDKIGQKMWVWYKANKELINSKIHEYAEKIGDGFEWVEGTSKQIGRLIERTGGLESWIKRLALAFALFTGIKIGTILVSIASGFATVGAAMSSLATLAVAITVLLGTVAAMFGFIIEDIMVYERGGDSFLGFLHENLEKLPAAFRALAYQLQFIYELFKLLKSGAKIVMGELDQWVIVLKPFLPWLINGMVLVGTAIALYLLAPLVLIIGFITLVARGLRAIWEIGDAFTSMLAEGLALVLVAWKLIGVFLKEQFFKVVDAVSASWDNQVAKVMRVYDALMMVWDIVSRVFSTLSDVPGLMAKIPGVVMKTLGPSGFGKALISQAPGLIPPQFRDKKRIADGPMVSRYKGAQKGGGGAKTVQVTAGDTNININGAADPNAVADKVQRSQKQTMDRTLNSAANTAGGL